MEDFVLAQNGRACRLCIAEGAPAAAHKAADELAAGLFNICGVRPAIAAGAPEKGDVCLGAHPQAAPGPEGFSLCEADGVLWLDGDGRGILYAAYELLERLGCRFFTADCEYYPKNPRPALPGGLCVAEKPVFEYRSAYWHSVTPALAPKHRLNAVLSARIPAELGGDVHYNGFVHTLGSLAELKTPDGDYTDRQPCLTDEKTFETVVKNLRRNLAADPTADIASVSQNDSHAEGRGCACARCRALDEAEGTPMGSLLTFVNRVADALAPDYPRLAVDTLAYRYTRRPPKNLMAHDNVIIRLCSIECCFSHPVEQHCPPFYAVEKEDFADTLRAWAQHSSRIYIWDYTTDYRNYNTCFPNFGVLRRNLRFFAENHVRGVFEQGNDQSVNGEFGELRAYVLAKLLWNPLMTEAEYQRHIDEFLAGYYGAGAPALRRFLDRLQAAAENVHFGIYYEDPTALFTDPDTDGTPLEKARAFLLRGREDFAAARAAASADERTRIERAEIQLDVYEWYLRRAELAAAAPADEAAARSRLAGAGEVLYAHALAHGITYMHESFVSEAERTFGRETPDFTSAPAFWGK